MTETGSNALMGIVILMGLMFAIITGVIIASRRKKTSLASEQKESSGSSYAEKIDHAKDLRPDGRPIEEHFELDKESKLTLEKEPKSDDFQASKTLKQALEKTEQGLWGRVRTLFSNETATKNFDELEEVLYTSDIGPKTVEKLMTAVKESLSRSEQGHLTAVKDTLRTQFLQIFSKAQMSEPTSQSPLQYLKQADQPTVWMIVGVNGAGKTTSIGKLAAHLAKSGKRVLVAAGDTFRAAAGNQLKAWTERAQVEIFSPEGVKDPSAVAFDAVAKAKAQGYDVVIIDTAGRLHTQAHLMEELKKMKRVMTKVIEAAPQETLIVLDSNSGQNALAQAKEFHAAVGLTGVILTKMDGTAKGGVAVGLADELQIPIRLIGVGEKVGDLRAFSSQEFIDSILTV